MIPRLLLIALGAALSLPAQKDKWEGPQPPKPDLLYLMHADNLAPTEVTEATPETRKDGEAHSIPGASSPARTPLAGPILLLRAEKLAPEKLALFRFAVVKGRREVFFSKRRPKDSTRPIRFSVRRFAEGIVRLEVDESLENGEYGFSPDGSQQVFAFQVY